MQLEAQRAVLRRRRPLEAIDLGFAMLRAWSGPALRAWVVGVLPPVFLIGVLLADHAWWAVLLLMWLAPVLERAPLHVLSRSLFGEAVGWGALARAAPGLWFRRLPSDLFLLRLSLYRSMLAPVAMLEQLRGDALYRRRTALARGQAPAALGLWAFCLTVELGAWLGLFSLCWSFLPDSPLYDLSLMFEEDVPTPPWFTTLLLGTWALSSSLTRMLYAAGGFGLYLNRRTEAEGWDIELRFRQLAQRAGSTLSAMLGIGVLMGILSAPLARAQEGEPPADDGAWNLEDEGDWLVEEGEPLDPPDQEILDRTFPDPAPPSLADALGEVLARPEMGAEEETTRWKLRSAWDWGWEWPEAEQSLPDWAVVLAELFGQALQLLLAVLLVLAIGGALTFLLRMRHRAGLARPAQRAGAALEGERVEAPEAGPALDALGREALRLLEAGQAEAALALLYRGAVALLVEGGLAVEDSATEGEVLRVARRALPEGPLQFFRGLTRHWQTVAYAHAPVDGAALRAEAEGIGALRAWARDAAGSGARP